MPNYIAIDGKWYNLCSDPVGAAKMVTNIQTLASNARTLANIQTQMRLVAGHGDFTAYANAYELSGTHGGWKWD